MESKIDELGLANICGFWGIMGLGGAKTQVDGELIEGWKVLSLKNGMKFEWITRL